MSLKEKFENINLEEVPEHLSFELETINEETDNFTDADGLSIFEKEFNYLYSIIKKKYPTALKDYVAPPLPPPSAEEIAEVLRKKQLADKEEADRIEAERLKQEKIEKAKALADKFKKKTAEEPASASE